MSTWFKPVVVCSVLWLFTGCGDPPNKCAGVTCGAGQTCDSATGQCKGTSGCSPACSGSTPVCQGTACVQCTDNTHCSGATPVCDTAVNTCKAAPVVDSGTPDSGTPDSGTPDSGTPDSGTPDSGTPDSGTPDSGTGSCAASAVVNLNSAGVQNGLRLSYTGNVEGRLSQIDAPTGCVTAQGAAPGPEAVHRFSVPVKADVMFTTDNAATVVDTVLYAMDVCAAGPAPVNACNDDVDPASGNFNSTILTQANAGATLNVVVDSFSNASVDADAGVYRLDVVVRPVVGMGAACDPAVVLSRCDTGLYCNGGSKTCALATAPSITTVNFVSYSATSGGVVISGLDPDQDVIGFNAEFLDVGGNPMSVLGTTEFPLSFDQPVQGASTFRGVARVNLAQLPSLPTGVRVALRDLLGNRSPRVTQTRAAATALNAGDGCDTTGFLNTCPAQAFCKPTASGSVAGTCTAGTAPALTAALGFYADAGASARVSVTATDTEGDITAVSVQYVQADGGLVLLADAGVRTDQLTFSLSEGTTAFQGYRLLSGTVMNTSTALQVSVRDATGLDSNALVVPLSPFPTRAAAETCDVRAFNDACGSGASMCTGTCETHTASTGTVCAAATTLTLGTAVTGTLGFGPDRWNGPCAGSKSSGGSESVYKFTLASASDVTFTTDFPETRVDTVLYVASNCGGAPTVVACNDDISYPSRVKSSGLMQDLAAGTYYVFVDSWRDTAFGAGTGPFKLLVSTRPVHATAGTACDPLFVADRCGGALRCRPDATYSAYTCQ